MVVDAVTFLDPELCDINLIGIKKVTGIYLEHKCPCCLVFLPWVSSSQAVQ